MPLIRIDPLMRALTVISVAASLTIGGAFVHGARAGADARVDVAVAANFLATAREIATAFEQHLKQRVASQARSRVVLSSGATGQLYAQITQGAPFDVFLAADQARPARLIADGLAVAGSRFSYAKGRLALVSNTHPLGSPAQLLRGAAWQRLAIANPTTAPYGEAALETLAHMGVAPRADRIVRGQNIAQAFQMFAAGAADLALVAAPMATGRHRPQHVWLVPPSHHAPIAQDVVLLVRGRDNADARAFLAFLQSPEARAMIADAGYTAPD